MEPDEYTRMDEIEARMWWYRALHARLLDALGQQSDAAPVLDAGCGTGGFLAMLPVRVPRVRPSGWSGTPPPRRSPPPNPLARSPAVASTNSPSPSGRLAL